MKIETRLFFMSLLLFNSLYHFIESGINIDVFLDWNHHKTPMIRINFPIIDSCQHHVENRFTYFY